MPGIGIGVGLPLLDSAPFILTAKGKRAPTMFLKVITLTPIEAV